MTVAVLCLIGGGLAVWALVWGGPIAKGVVGVCLIIAAILWVPVWLFAVAYAGAPLDIRLWAVFCALLAVGILVFSVGYSLVLYRRPRRYDWLVWSAVIFVPLVLFLFVFEYNRGAARINPAVSRAYEDLRQENLRIAYTDCEYTSEDSEGVETWVCAVEPEYESVRTCQVEVRRRSLWSISVHLESCRHRES